MREITASHFNFCFIVEMDGVKTTAVGLITLPTELIQRIGIICDVKSLGNLCRTCKLLNFVLSDEVVWYVSLFSDFY